MLNAKSDEDKKWQAECDMRTLMEAKKIESDPKRLKAAQAMAKEKMMEAAKVASED